MPRATAYDRLDEVGLFAAAEHVDRDAARRQPAPASKTDEEPGAGCSIGPRLALDSSHSPLARPPAGRDAPASPRTAQLQPLVLPQFGHL